MYKTIHKTTATSLQISINNVHAKASVFDFTDANRCIFGLSFYGGIPKRFLIEASRFYDLPVSTCYMFLFPATKITTFELNGKTFKRLKANCTPQQAIKLLTEMRNSYAR